MNTKVLRILMIAVFSATICGCDNKGTSSVLKNDEVRKELYSEILSNHEYLREFMDSMKTSDHARIMMHLDTALSRRIMKNLETQVIIDHLMARTEKDSAACKLVCKSMVDHKKVMATMLETLSETGVIKKGCMMDKSEKKTQQSEKKQHH